MRSGRELARDVTLLLRRLVDAGLLDKHGERSDAWYSVAGAERALPLFERAGNHGAPRASGATSGASDATSGASDPTSGASGATSGASGATSGASDPTSGASGATSGASDATSSASGATSSASDATSGATWASSSVVERVRASRRVRSEVLDAAILEVCRERFLTREEIARALGRAVNSLRARNLPRLVREGRLELRYPEHRNHPRQAYRAVDRGQGATP